MTLETVSRCMPAGILIGIAVIAFAVQQSLLPAFGLLLLLGGVRRVLYRTAERAAAGAWEDIRSGQVTPLRYTEPRWMNVAMLLMLGLYSLAVSVGVPPVAVGIGFGAVFAVAIAALWVWGRRK